MIGQSQLGVSVITVAELYFGAFNKTELRYIQHHLQQLTVYSLTSAISNHFLELMARYALSHKLAIPDALIAATAIENGLPLYTLNVRDFRFIDGLQLYSP